MAPPDRHVRHLRLAARAEADVRHLLPSLEDALRCASLPDDARCYFLRRLTLPRAPTLTAQGYARLIEQAGADALELNIYYVATDADETSEHVEGRVLDTIKTVKSAVKIPVAAKLSPFFSSIFTGT